MGGGVSLEEKNKTVSIDVSKKDFKQMNDIVGIKNLRNYGTNCYINAILQCLYHCTYFRSELVGHYSSYCETAPKLGNYLYELFDSIVQKRSSSKNTVNFSFEVF